MLFVLVLVACGSDWSLTGEVPDVNADFRVENNVIEVDVITIDRGVPERFSAPWPVGLVDMQAGRHPVSAHWAYQVSVGASNARERYGARLDELEANGGDVQGWMDWVWNSTDSHCDWLVEQLEDDPGPSLRAPLMRRLAHCSDPELKSWFDRDDAPVDAVLDWHNVQWNNHNLVHPEGLSRTIARVMNDGVPEFTAAMVLLGRRDSPAATAGLLNIWHLKNGPQDQSLRQFIALSMGAQSDPAAREIFLRACDAAPDDHRCTDVDPLRDLSAVVTDYGREPSELFLAYPGHASAIHAALADCYALAVDHTLPSTLGRRCLLASARQDRSMAVQMVQQRGRPDLDDPSDLAPLITELLTYPDAAALAAQLVSWGMLPKQPEAGIDVVTAFEILETAGVAREISPVGGEYLARDLATFAGLDGVVVATWPRMPLTDPETLPMGHEPRVPLRAYMDGRRHQVLMSVDSRQVEPVVGLINALLVARHRTERLVMLDETSVFLGDPKSVLPALKAGTFAPYEPAWSDVGYEEY